MGIEILLRLGDLIEFMLTTFANLVTGNHAVGKMVAKSSPSHNAAEWTCVYTNLFSTDATWKDSKACYEYFNSL